jgi:hypothetical protein
MSNGPGRGGPVLGSDCLGRTSHRRTFREGTDNRVIRVLTQSRQSAADFAVMHNTAPFNNVVGCGPRPEGSRRERARETTRVHIAAWRRGGIVAARCAGSGPYPVSLRPCRKALKRLANAAGDSAPRYPITGIAGCCACKAIGRAAAAPPSSVMNSRRRISAPKLRGQHCMTQTTTLIGLKPGIKTIAAVHSQCR